MDKKINVSENIDSLIERTAKSFKLSKKGFVEAAVMYFISRNINPAKIKEGEGMAILNHVTKEINRAIGFQIRQEKTFLFHILKDLSFLDLRFQILESNILDALNLEEEQIKQMSEDNKSYYTEKKKVLEEKIKKMFLEVGH